MYHPGTVLGNVLYSSFSKDLSLSLPVLSEIVDVIGNSLFLVPSFLGGTSEGLIRPVIFLRKKERERERENSFCSRVT